MKKSINKQLKKALADILSRDADSDDLFRIKQLTDELNEIFMNRIYADIQKYVDSNYIQISEKEFEYRHQQLTVNMDNLRDEFGKIVVLEGDNDIFNEYNHLAIDFKEIYSGKDIVGFDRLWYKNEDELVKIFIEIFTSREPISILIYTTGTRKDMLKALSNIANNVYTELKKNGFKHNIKYLIEQYDKRYFEDIARDLGINYISNLDFIFDTNTEDNREILKVDFVKNINDKD